MFDVTPLENLFIEEYMLRAPGDFVKVYIYGLRLCYHPVEDATVPAISRALGLEEKTVLDAFAYWERVGVLHRIADNPPAYSFFNLKEAMLTGKAEGDIPKADRDFNIALQDLFGTRLLQAQDYERVYKIMEEMGFAPEVVLMLVKHCIERSGKGTAVSLRLHREGGRALGQEGGDDPALGRGLPAHALRLLRGRAEGAAPARPAPRPDGRRGGALHQVDARMGLFPGGDPLLVRGDDQDLPAELRLPGQGAGEPAQEAAQHQRGDGQRPAGARGRHAPVREVLDALGVKGVSPTEDLAMVYAAWLKMGFSPRGGPARGALYAAPGQQPV